MHLEELQTGSRVRGLCADGPVTVVSVAWAGNHALTVIYRDQAGALGERLLYRDDEGALQVDAAGRPWS